MTDVVFAAWKASGSPPPTPDVSPLPPGLCARCNRLAELTRTTAAISKLFTAFDSWATPTGPGLCAPCAWGYRTPELRNKIHQVSVNDLVNLTRSEAAEILSSGAIANDSTLVVPLRPGRKHLVAEASWGTVTTDTATLPWTRHDADRLEVLLELRGAGFGSRMLAAPAPAWNVLRRHDATHWVHLLQLWTLLDPWRQRPAWLELALHVTTTTTRSAA